MGPEYTELKSLVRREGLHTVCEEAGCPNIYECWEDREATFLIGGEQCTRRCDFCQIDTGKPAELDRDEPRRVAESVAAMGLRYATVTGVARDDLPDGGAWLYAETVRAIKELNPSTGVELLIPDFNGEPELLRAGVRVSSRSVGAQRRNRAAHLQADPARVPLPAQPRRADRGARVRSGDQEQPHPRHGRDHRRGPHRAGRSARRRLRHRHHHPVPAAVAAPPPGRALGASRGVRRRWPPSPRASASPVCWPGRWCGRRTGRAGCTRRRSPRGLREPPRRRHPTPYPDPMAKSRIRRPDQGRQGRGEGRPQGRLQAAPQSAVAGVPDAAQGGQAPPAVHDRRVRADRGRRRWPWASTPAGSRCTC